MSVRLLIIGVVMGVFLLCCDSSRLYEKNQDISNYAWNMNDTLLYSFELTDVSKPIHSYINIRHRFEFDWRNIWMKATLIYPNDSAYVFPVNILLSEPNGHWYGNCRGDVCMLQTPLTEKYAFQYTDTGIYTLKINHEMRENPLKGIMSVGFRLDNKTQNEPK